MSNWDHVTDFLVIGSGAGAVGALRADALGKEALVVEKTDLFGGSTAMSGGVVWIPNNPIMQREGVADSLESGLDYLDSLVGDVGPASSEARRRAYLVEGNEMVYFLESEGVTFKRCPRMADYYAGMRGYRNGSAEGRSIEPHMFDTKKLGEWRTRLRPGFSPVLNIYTGEGSALQSIKTKAGRSTAARVGARTVWGRVKGQRNVLNGAALQARILAALLRRRVPVWLNSPVTELITEGDRVVGAVVDRDGTPTRVRARDGVLISVGGFSRNLEMREKYAGNLGPQSVSWTVSNPGDTGEVIQMAMELGADTDMLDEAWWMPVWMDGETPQMAMTVGAKPHSITVDNQGQRFYNESISYQEVGQRIYEHHRKTGAALPAWQIIDTQHRESYTFGMALPGKKSHRRWVDEGSWQEGATLRELAQKCGIDPDGLEKTVERFNGFARKGVDDDFERGVGGWSVFYGDPDNKPNECLGTLEKGPFYAIPIYPGDIGTSGGLMTDEHGRVLREDGSAVQGLFASGNSTASVFGRAYPGAGATIGASALYAYTAANFIGRESGE